jgi:Mlc titration factor MtfA (ptsG expression regulator)
MSHALKLENAIKNGEYGFMSTLLLGRLHKISLIQMRKIRKGEETFIRKYAASNHEEFFAVSIEYFFERPTDLKKTIPTLYDILHKLLRQDPAKRIQAARLINS